MDDLEDEKHQLSVLVELVLYPQIRAINELSKGNKEQSIKEITERFVKNNRMRFATLTDEEYLATINKALERTKKNINEIKENKVSNEQENALSRMTSSKMSNNVKDSVKGSLDEKSRE